MGQLCFLWYSLWSFERDWGEAGAREHAFRANSVYFEPTVIDEVEPGARRQLFCSGKLTGVKEDAIDNSARGHYILEKENINLCLNRIRNLANSCVNLQVIQVFSWGIEKEIKQAKPSSNDAGGLPPAAKRLRHHRNAKQPLKPFLKIFLPVFFHVLPPWFLLCGGHILVFESCSMHGLWVRERVWVLAFQMDLWCMNLKSY